MAPGGAARVLIVRPDASRLGGIEAYFLKLLPHMRVACESLGIARRPQERGWRGRVRRLLADYLRCYARLADRDVALVHLNPSLEPRSFFRDAVFMLFARWHGKKTLVFFHGWDPGFERRLEQWGGRLFRLLYGAADAYVVLSPPFAAALRRWGVMQPIHTERIVIEDHAIAAFDLERALQGRRRAAPRTRLLFASRLLRSKGLMTAIGALRILQRSNPHFELVVAGEGEMAGEARELVRRLHVPNVVFVGQVSGEEKYELFRSAHFFCFPTEHAEGFPNVIVEAMAFGLPIVTRPVGGIPAHCRHGVHGYLTQSTAPEAFAALILGLVADPQRYRRMAQAAHREARSLFLASDAARRMERIYASLGLLDAESPANSPALIAASRGTGPSASRMPRAAPSGRSAGRRSWARSGR